MVKELKKILFVDDDQDIHLIVSMSLMDIPNIEILSAFSGEEAIKKAMEFQPDLILLDVMMPRMDGIATLKALKLFPSFASTPIVFITAKAQKDEIESYFQHGILDVIIKPFNPLTLAPTIQDLWKKSQKIEL